MDDLFETVLRFLRERDTDNATTLAMVCAEFMSDSDLLLLIEYLRGLREMER